MLTANQQLQHAQFKAAKEIALNIGKGEMRRARHNDMATAYCGMQDNSGRMWVIADSSAYLQNPDAMIDGKPAREVFGDFSILIK